MVSVLSRRKAPTAVRELDLSSVWGEEPRPTPKRRTKGGKNTGGRRAHTGGAGPRGPRAAEHGRAASLNVAKTWRATTSQVCGLYPFLSAEPMPPVGVPLGVDVHAGTTFSYAPVEWLLRGIVENPNILLTGKPGSGKSTCTKIAMLRSAAVGVQTLVPGDIKGEYNLLAEFLGVTPTILGGGSPARLNPLDAGPLGKRLPNDQETRKERIEEVHRRRLSLASALAATGLARPLTSTEQAVLGLCLRRTEALGQVKGALRDPLIAEVFSELGRLSDEDCRELRFRGTEEYRDELRPMVNALRSMLDGVLAGIFDGPTTHPLDFDAPIQTVDISRLESRGEEAVAMVLACLSSWGQAAVDDPEADEFAPTRQVIRDEVWRQLRYPWLVNKIDSDLRLSRKHGVVQFLVTHELGDFDGAANPELARLIAKKCAVRVVYAQQLRPDSPIARELDLNPTECQLVSSWSAAQRGRGLWRIGPQRGYVVQTRLTRTELALTHTDEKMRV